MNSEHGYHDACRAARCRNALDIVGHVHLKFVMCKNTIHYTCILYEYALQRTKLSKTLKNEKCVLKRKNKK